jgi:hypothetical protein
MKTPYVFKGKLGSNLNIQHLAAESGVVMMPLGIRVCRAGFFLAISRRRNEYALIFHPSAVRRNPAGVRSKHLTFQGEKLTPDPPTRKATARQER